MFAGCSYQTNVYGAFQTHKWRKHTPHTINNLKPGIVSGPFDCPVVELFERDSPEQSDDALPSEEISAEFSDLTKAIELKLASVLLKLENCFLVSSAAVNELLEELQHLIGTASVPVIQNIIAGYLQDNNCGVDESVVKELATVLCTSNPIQAAIGRGGPLSTTWKRKGCYRKNFNVVEPVEYVLDRKNRRSFEYIPNPKILAATSEL